MIRGLLFGLLLLLAVGASSQGEEESRQRTTNSPAVAPCPAATATAAPGCPHRRKAATLVPSFTKTTPRPTTKHTTPHHTTKHATTNHTTPHHTTANHTTPHHTTKHATTNHTTPHHTTKHATTNHTTPHHTTANHTTPHPITSHTTAPANRTTPHHTTKHTTPPPSNHTTAHPHNRTTAQPTNHTTPHAHTTAPPPTQSPGVDVGNYVVGNKSAACVRVQSALQIRVQYQARNKQQFLGLFAIQPNHTNVSGSCHNKTVTLHLSFPEGFLLFTFQKNQTKKTFYLSRVQANLTYYFPQALGSHFAADNASLREFEAPLGDSYQCRNRSLALGPGFHVDTLHEQVQAFSLTGDQFGKAHECPEQQRSLVVPIVVGIILLVLIIIIIIAYLVGRRRSRDGYQTL